MAIYSNKTVAEIGEFGLIELLAAQFGSPTQSAVSVGIGDDSAVIASTGEQVVACLDVLTQGVHFRLDWSSANDIGHKAAAANLADIFAMGATPTALLVGLAIPSDTKVAWVLELAGGLRDEAQRVGVQVVGGDVVRGDAVTISVTALGTLENRQPILRSGAKPGDVVALAGQLGYSAAGLLMLSRGFRSPRVLVNAHRIPTPPYELAALATKATAMIDVSDGLVADLGHIARASQVAINIDTAQLDTAGPLDEMAGVFRVDPLQWVLTGGEDHAFVATFSQLSDVPADWRVIGEVTQGESAVLVNGHPSEVEGWHHFQS